MKKIRLYNIIDSKNNRTLSIVMSKKQVAEYLDAYLKGSNFNHYKMWCELRNLELDENSWRQYKFATRPSLEGIVIKTGKMEISYLLSAFRTVCGCLPLMLPWETDAEMSTFIDSLPDEARIEILKEMKN